MGMNIKKILKIERKDLLDRYKSLLSLNMRMGRRKFIKKYTLLIEKLTNQK
jgi:hypothetical protein